MYQPNEVHPDWLPAFRFFGELLFKGAKQLDFALQNGSTAGMPEEYIISLKDMSTG